VVNGAANSPAVRGMVTAVVPALNEEKNVAAAVASIKSAADEMAGVEVEIIVVNDGSTDATGKIADECARTMPCVRVIHHANPQGVGASFREALAQARGEKFTIFAGDNNVSSCLVRDLLRNKDAADVVVSYVMNTEERGSFRHVVSTLFSMTYVLFFGIHLKYINGNTVWPTCLLRDCDIQARGYSIMAETNVKMLRRDLSFLEIPGEMNKAATKSQAIKFSNFVEVIGTFLSLLWQVHVSRRGTYGFAARRVSRESN
jgi:Glycosyl transferase family 2